MSLCCAVMGVLFYVFSCYTMSARFCVTVLCCYRCFVLCFFHAILCQQDSVSLCCAVIGVLSYVFNAIV